MDFMKSCAPCFFKRDQQESEINTERETNRNSKATKSTKTFSTGTIRNTINNTQ